MHAPDAESLGTRPSNTYMYIYDEKHCHKFVWSTSKYVSDAKYFVWSVDIKIIIHVHVYPMLFKIMFNCTTVEVSYMEICDHNSPPPPPPL